LRRQVLDFSNGLQDVSQPVINGRRHSEHLDQIVGDPLDYARLQLVSH